MKSDPIDVTEGQLGLPAMPERAAIVSTGLNPETLLAKAIDANVPIETIERLIALRDKLQAENARREYYSALSAFQGECPVIHKGQIAKGSGSYSYAYAPLDEIVRQTAPILRRHGLSVTFDTVDEDGFKTSLCTVHHVAGHSETTRFRVPIDAKASMNDSQKHGSANTYANRYNYNNALGILTGDQDDDAHLGGTKNGEQPPGGPRTFAPPQRASASTPPAVAPVPEGDKGPPPDDAISEPKIKRVYALIGVALERHGMKNAQALAAVEDALDAVILQQRRRKSWKFCSWKGQDYQSMCGNIDAVVDDLAERGELVPAGSKPRVVKVRK